MGRLGWNWEVFQGEKMAIQVLYCIFPDLVVVIHLCLLNHNISVCSILVKLARQREQWSLAWVASICLELLFLEPCWSIPFTWCIRTLVFRLCYFSALTSVFLLIQRDTAVAPSSFIKFVADIFPLLQVMTSISIF